MEVDSVASSLPEQKKESNPFSSEALRLASKQPSCWDIVSAQPSLVKILKDKLTISYTGNANHSDDVGSVRANIDLSAQPSIYYFEVAILSAGTRRSSPHFTFLLRRFVTRIFTLSSLLFELSALLLWALLPKPFPSTSKWDPHPTRTDTVGRMERKPTLRFLCAVSRMQVHSLLRT
jgi:hypothetical protein